MIKPKDIELIPIAGCTDGHEQNLTLKVKRY